jgi:hypothetical protein
LKKPEADGGAVRETGSTRYLGFTSDEWMKAFDDVREDILGADSEVSLKDNTITIQTEMKAVCELIGGSTMQEKLNAFLQINDMGTHGSKAAKIQRMAKFILGL